jgi:hypothetical protein
VRLNKSFIVKRDLISRQRLEGAMQLSNYVHFALSKKKQSVWIAQREGRAKDSDDRTQESLLKMLGMGGEGKTFYSRIKNITFNQSLKIKLERLGTNRVFFNFSFY